MPTQLTIALVPIARPTFDIALAQAISDSVRDQLVARGYQLAGPAALVMTGAGAAAAAAELAGAPVDLLLILQATFADSTMLTRIAAATDAPLLLWAMPEAPVGGRLRLNSLCGVNLGGHALRLQGRRYAHAYDPPEAAAVYDQIEALARAGQVRRRLRQSRVAVIGQHPAGMDTCHLDAAQLATTFGLAVAELDLTTLFERMDAAPAGAIGMLRRDLDARLPNLAGLAQEPLLGTLSAYHALRQIQAEADVAGFAIRCWPEFFESQGCAACGAMSLLNDDQVPAACEADVNGTVTQLMLQWLSGSPAFGADVVAVDREADFAVVWHCGKAPLGMADPEAVAEGGIHSNRQVPLVMEFPLRPGRVTVARLSRATGSLRLVVGGGTMLAGPMSFSGTSGRLRFDRPAGQVLQTILDEGLEHHVAITYGDVVRSLLALAELLALPVLAL